MARDKKAWFRAKSYGWGWTPATWQGWALLAAWAVIYTALIIGCALAADAANWTVFTLLIALALAVTAALAWVSWRKGEPARWRWGNRT